MSAETEAAANPDPERVPCPRCGEDYLPRSVCQSCGFALAEVWRRALIQLLEASEVERSCRVLHEERASVYAGERLACAEISRRTLERHLWKQLLVGLSDEESERLATSTEELVAEETL